MYCWISLINSFINVDVRPREHLFIFVLNLAINFWPTNVYLTMPVLRYFSQYINSWLENAVVGIHEISVVSDRSVISCSRPANSLFSWAQVGGSPESSFFFSKRQRRPS